MELSVIIPTLNEEEKIESCLDAIFSQSLFPREVIIVDGYSTDKTVEIAKSYFDPAIKLKIFRYDGNVGGARDLATRRASGEIIFSTDADAVLKRSDHLRQIERDFTTHDIACWKGTIEDPDFPLQSVLLNFFLKLGGVCGANFAFRKAAYLSVGGFPHVSIAEDTGLWTKLMRKYPCKHMYREEYAVEMRFNLWKWAEEGVSEYSSRSKWQELLNLARI